MTGNEKKLCHFICTAESEPEIKELAGRVLKSVNIISVGQGRGNFENAIIKIRENNFMALPCDQDGNEKEIPENEIQSFSLFGSVVQYTIMVSEADYSILTLQRKERERSR